MKTLKEFWNSVSVIYNFVDRNGVSIDEVDYPIETEVLEERLVADNEYEVRLNVEAMTTDEMLEELQQIDVANQYRFTCYDNVLWKVRNTITLEGLTTDGGFWKVKRWLLDDIEKNHKKMR